MFAKSEMEISSPSGLWRVGLPNRPRSCRSPGSPIEATSRVGGLIYETWRDSAACIDARPARVGADSSSADP